MVNAKGKRTRRRRRRKRGGIKCDYLSAITGQSHLTRNVRYGHYVSMRLRESIEPGCGEARQRDRLNSQINR